MSTPSYGSPVGPIATARPPRQPLDAAAAVLLGLAIAALVVGVVVGLRGFFVDVDTARSDRLCDSTLSTPGECLQAIEARHLAGSALMTQGGALLAGGAALLGAGTWRGAVVVRYRRATGG